jgi:outer membrane scaffolding protein for murein synthesis (MipA/OmpV family)
MNRAAILLLAVFLFALPASLYGAEELPLWEAGAGVAGLSVPDYRGSDERHGYLLPIPYVQYRGDILRMDRKGMYGLLYHSQQAELNISFDGGVPVKSGRNTARTGMPDLDPAIQIGPSLEICLVQDCDADRVAQLRFPVRAVVASDFSRFTGIGFVSNPQLNFDFKNIGPGGGWNFGFALGPLFATERYHDYYYQVSPQYAIPDVRPAYDARSGYSGMLLILALSKRFDHIWFGAFTRYDDLTGAAFENSPLMKTGHSLMAGFGLAWVFGRSQTFVHASP